MNELTNWAKNIIYFILFVKLITSLLPKGKMERYIKLFTGILLIIILLKPILELKGIEKKLKDYMIDIEKEQQIHSLNSQSISYEDINDQLALDLYKKRVIKHIELILKEDEIEIDQLYLSIHEKKESKEYGNIEHMDLWVEEKEKFSKEGMASERVLFIKKIKSRIKEFYMIDADQIEINFTS